MLLLVFVMLKRKKGEVFKIRIQKNSRNDQLLITIPRRKLDLVVRGKRSPKFLKVKKEDLVF